MTRPFTSALIQFGTDGPILTTAFGPPPPPFAPLPTPIGSFYINRDDGSWWQKVVGDTWQEMTGGGSGPSSVFTAPNGESSTIVAGTPIAIVSSFAMRGLASSQVLALITGIAIVDAGPTLPLSILTQGPLTMSESAWDEITGSIGGLVPDAVYYLDGTPPGRLTTTPPSASGASITEVGQAVSSTTMIVSPSRPVLL